MKIHFDGVNFGSRSGPNSFARRLAESLYNQGHEISDPNTNYDIMLTFIEPTKTHNVNSKLVQRLDGIWFKPDDFISKNVGIKRCYQSSDGVIWQSEFDKNMVQHHWGVRNGDVIHNGIKLEKVMSLHPALAGIKSSYKTIFACSANWHHQKRLQANIELFQHCEQFYDNACLLVMGSNSHIAISHKKNIIFTGDISHDLCLQAFAISNWMIHLAWLDHCPNTVIESISQNTPVICADSGGTPEIVGEFGIIIPEKEEYKFQLTNYDVPPQIDVTFVTQKMLQDSYQVDQSKFDINNIAKRYVNMFERLLS